ncbi:Putative glyoxylase CFP32 [Methylobacterium longum]|uniref:VOC family protein n=2 Tax=Methylobacterium longum TaxID=767694 RepID=A0ABT8AJJ2_9HYPH|nr:VOC family protein [Methylobacterium longum]MDN3569994.1 VOC family protein [Methylobacterium longum]GJE12779.1 Putative glyoxylase CFP32 [Methylobacterium longum]
MRTVDGKPIWFELNATDPDAVQAFYEGVADWRVTPSSMPEHGGYRIAEVDGRPVAGIRRTMAETPGFPGWAVYLATRDVDAMASRVVDLGGQIRFGPVDIPHVGRFAMVSDPQDVVFALMAAATPADSQAFGPVPLGAEQTLGCGVWIELATPDPEAAFRFYGALFGWEKLGAMPMGGMSEYAFIGRGDLRPGAVMSSAATGAPARWNWYVHVADIDAALATVRDRGGTVLQGPDPIPGGSYSANIADPAGNRFGLAGPRQAV